jgi:hypothetical protein
LRLTYWFDDIGVGLLALASWWLQWYARRGNGKRRLSRFGDNF